jgi:hypothetical protein
MPGPVIPVCAACLSMWVIRPSPGEFPEKGPCHSVICTRVPFGSSRHGEMIRSATIYNTKSSPLKIGVSRFSTTRLSSENGPSPTKFELAMAGDEEGADSIRSEKSSA